MSSCLVKKHNKRCRYCGNLLTVISYSDYRDDWKCYFCNCESVKLLDELKEKEEEFFNFKREIEEKIKKISKFTLKNFSIDSSKLRTDGTIDMSDIFITENIEYK